MNFFKKLFSFSSGNTGSAYPFAVQCQRCGEVLHGRANLNSELSIEYDDSGNTTGYYVRKVLMGRERCFQQIEVTLTFDARRNLKDKQITGGKFVEGQ